MKTKCSECGSEMVKVGTNLVIPEKSVYQTVFGCMSCPTKLETSRVLHITEIESFNPNAIKEDGQATLARF